MHTVKIFKQGNSIAITIPYALRRVLKWAAGDHLTLDLATKPGTQHNPEHVAQTVGPDARVILRRINPRKEEH
jgi:bifunctional DNA-binding transcriptional regulator/antitoxin component of YhaV-PrlF toxin-antitoxin module